MQLEKIDWQVEAPGSTIYAFGEMIEDVIITVGSLLPLTGQVDGIISHHTGGCAPHVARGAASLGQPAGFIGHVGADETGKDLVGRIARAGVRQFGPIRGATASSVSIDSDMGSVVLIFDPGSSRTMKPEDFSDVALEDAAVLHLNGHHLYSSETRDAWRTLAQRAVDYGVPLSIDVSAPNRLRDYGVDFFLHELENLRPAFLFCNSEEQRVLGVESVPPPGVGMMITHRAEEPTMALASNGRSTLVPLHRHVEVVDVTGAGDAFASGFLTSWARRSSVEDAIWQGHELAADVVNGRGVEFVERG